MVWYFDSVEGKTAEVLNAIMASEVIPSEESKRFKIRLCTEEVVENVVQYAYKPDTGPLEVSAFVKDGNLMIAFKDHGKEFNPLEVPDPDITLGASERQIGGLGIFICKNLMDKLSYKREDGNNILTMTINIK